MENKKIKNKSSLLKFGTAFLILIFLVGGAIALELYSRIYKPNVILSKDVTEKYIYIPDGADFSTVVKILSEEGLLINKNSFEWLATQKKYDTNPIKSGRYRITADLNNNELINLLRSGDQTPVMVTFNNLRTKEQLAGIIASQLEVDSVALLSYITDTAFQKRLGLTNDNVISIFIPNSYKVYWNASAKQFVQKMQKEHETFWSVDRKIKAKKIKLTPLEVVTLASIVEKEQNIKKDERPKIAGLYLNRIKKKMKLESDPTLIFALGDFTINRVLNKDKKVDSPFNTYKHKGLPPGPICIPSINAVDAVLNASEHEYIFMCAKEDFSGYHNFAKTYVKHMINARKYHKAMNKRKIMR